MARKLWIMLLTMSMIWGMTTPGFAKKADLSGLKIRPGMTAFSTLKGRQEPRYTAEDVAAVLKENCPELLALDLGHNDVSDLSFVAAWPKLRRLIIVDSKTPITDISPLEGLNDLEYVELFMQGITDISPLAGKTGLKDLNLAHNDITDLTPLYSCTGLQRLWINANPHLSAEQVSAFQEAVPGCRVNTRGFPSTGMGWREHPHYTVLMDNFRSGDYIPFEDSEPLPGAPKKNGVVTVTEIKTGTDLTDTDPAPAESSAETTTNAENGETGTVSSEAFARDISDDCLVGGRKMGPTHPLTDGNYNQVVQTGIRYGIHSMEIAAPEGETIGGLVVRWDKNGMPLTIETMNAQGEWITAAETDGDFFVDYIPLPGVKECRIMHRENPATQLSLVELTVLTPGRLPADIQVWQKPEKVDLMLIAGHPDDELLWFGGLLPYYAGQLQKRTLVVCCAMSVRMREQEQKS